MHYLIHHALRVFLDAEGIDEKQQITLMVIALLATLLVYLLRNRHRHGLIMTFLFTTLTLAGLLFLFTGSQATRHWSALVAVTTMMAIFVWEFMRRRRAMADTGRP